MKNINVNKMVEAMKSEIEYAWKDYYTTCMKVENSEVISEKDSYEWEKVIEKKRNIARLTGRQFFFLLEEMDLDIDLKVREIKDRVRKEVEEKIYGY